MFDALVRDWKEGMNALKNTIMIAVGLGFAGFYSPFFGLLVLPAAVFVGIMNAAVSDGHKIAAFIVGTVFAMVMFGVTFGVGFGLAALFRS